VRILKNGSVKNGDPVRLTKRQDSISVQKVFQLLYATEFDREAVEKAVNDPFIAQSCRKDLLKRWGSYLS
jgi:MOSC domain-containing protein YiiM